MGSLVFGLDIGIASVGWAVLNDQRIVDLGVRCFDKAETAKDGESLNLARRQARLLRRRLYRRAWRLTKLARLLKHEGLIPSPGYFKQSPAVQDSAWQLRVAGLDRQLSPLEWARVIYHLCKHRGFHWVSKAEETQADSDVEGGRVKKSLKDTGARMAEKGYRSAAEMVLTEFSTAQRNKQGSYEKALSRVLLDQELARLFETQRQLGNPYASERFEALIRGTDAERGGLFWQQKPLQNVLHMLGKCTFETNEYRAPKASFSAERHVWLTRLNNLRIVVDGVSRALNEAERAAVLNLPYVSGEKFTYKNLRNALVKHGLLPESFRFGGLSYPSDAAKETDKVKDPEDQILVKLQVWHKLRLAFKREKQETIWQQISTPALEGRPELLDQIGWVLSVYKDDAEVEQQLRLLDLPNVEGDPRACLDVLLKLRFDKFSNLSLKALHRIVPLMETGLRYDEAVARIPEYGHHSQLKPIAEGKALYLPPFYQSQRKYQNKTDRVGSMQFRDDIDIPRNPVVLRSLNQARKVVNALIREYGSPTAVHIEMARDLSRPLDERRDIEKLQKEFRDNKQRAIDDFEQTFGYKPKASTFDKWMLYREQNGQCAYSQKPLDVDRVLEDSGYTQIDHILPRSRSFDYSKNNQVLVLAKENQDKGNRTPFEYLTSFPGGENGERWRNFVAWVQGTKSYRMAKRNRLLRKNYGHDEAKGFRDRNLNDTRYICRFFKNYVERNLQLAARGDGEFNRRCVVVNGQLTAFLRARWGLIKIRSDSDRHHALDAAVVAACSHGMVKALADHARRKEIEFLKEGFPDPETGEIVNPAAHAQIGKHFPEPWANFRDELKARLYTDDVQALREALTQLGRYDAQALNTVRPLFVSRAVQRRGTPALHEATLRSPKYVSNNESAVRIRLTKLTPNKLDKIIEADRRNKPLVEALRQRLAEHANDPVKAFSTPFYKPSAAGKAAPLVTSITVLETQKTGMRLPHAIAELGEMTGINVFRLKQGFFIEPIYPAAPDLRLNVKPPPESAEFLFRLAKNELVQVSINDEICLGYFVMFESDGRVTLRMHDQPQPDKKFFRKSVNSAKEIRKFNVDVLGRIYPAPKETRLGLA